MELQIKDVKEVPMEFDINCEIGNSGDWACILNKSDMFLHKLTHRWKFYYPVSPNYGGGFDELKLLTCPGEGYVPWEPWCTFNSQYTYEINIHLDLCPYLA